MQANSYCGTNRSYSADVSMLICYCFCYELIGLSICETINSHYTRRICTLLFVCYVDKVIFVCYSYVIFDICVCYLWHHQVLLILYEEGQIYVPYSQLTQFIVSLDQIFVCNNPPKVSNFLFFTKFVGLYCTVISKLPAFLALIRKFVKVCFIFSMTQVLLK